jgi:hypothetical protein
MDGDRMSDELRIANHTMGFWRIDAQDPERLQYAPNFVHCPSGSLAHDGNRGPLEGWTWYDDHTDAMDALEMPIEAVDAALAEHGLRRA